ncbi:hypothetical protein KY310_04595 [Candidatus Woesearchaeota archaeon]|nr:hypothetical protein [Candidatus Woesearchaeota archaeon]
MTEKLEYFVCIEKEGRSGPVFAFSRFGRSAVYDGFPIYSKDALERQVALLAKHVRARMEHRGIDKVCFTYALPALKDEDAIQRWAELESLGVSRDDSRGADLIFDLLKKHFPEAEYKK